MTRPSRLGYAKNSPELKSMGLRERAELALATYRHISEATYCWLWTGAKLPTGHGQIRVAGRCYLVHRLAAFLWLGLDIENRFVGSRKDCSQVNHKCSNPSCFNPEHLYIGTQKENIGDIPRERLSAIRSQTQCRKGHVYTPETYSRLRGCLLCFKEYQRQWAIAHREERYAMTRTWRASKKLEQTAVAAEN